MNRIHRLAFNSATGLCQVVSEIARRSQGGGSVTAAAAAKQVTSRSVLPRLSAMACVLAIFAATTAWRPARADGGAGGNNGAFAGGGGGTYASPDGKDGTTPGAPYVGAGGGGGGVYVNGANAGLGGNGGRGGAGGASGGGSGGVGGTPGHVAGDGETVSSNITGSNGGAGGNGSAGGGGGGGGAGAVGTTGTVSVTGSLLGGNGGTGGNGSGTGGGGGQGGAGFVANGSDIGMVNSGTIYGGNGGGGGGGGSGAGRPGSGGTGIVGVSSVVNSGVISGGLSGDGAVRANAIEFTGAANTLELRRGSTITGNVVGALGGTNTLVLGGAVNDTFDTSSIGSAAQYRNFTDFEKTGTSTFTLTGTTSQKTSWSVLGGTLAISADANLGASSGGLTLDGGTLQTTATFSTARPTTLNAGGGTFDVQTGTTLTNSGVLSGAGAFRKTNSGALVLTGNSIYTGGTTIGAGTLQLGSGGTTGSIVGNVTNNGTLAFNRSDASAFAGVISGAGAVSQIGTGVLTLTGANSYSGGTSISAGTLQIGNGSTSGSIVGNVTNNAALVFNRSDAFNYAGTVTGTGALTQAGTGATTLTGAGSSVGSASISAGTLRLAQMGAFTTSGNYTTGAATTQIAADASLVVGGAFTQSVGSTLSVGLGSTQPVITAASANLAGTVNVTGFGVSAPSSASALTSTLFNVIHTTGGITNDFAAVNIGGATSPVDYLTLAAGKSADGLDYNVGFGLTWLAGPTLGNGTFTLADAADTFNVDMVLSDQSASSGSWNGKTLTKSGAGTVTLSAANTYTGGTTITGGTLQLGEGGTTGSLEGNVTNNAILAFNRSDISTFTGVISGTGQLNQNGSGTTVLSADSTYTGGTAISAGTLQLGSGGTTGGIVGNVTNNGTLAFNRSDASAFAGVISGAGTVSQIGTGTTILTGANTYSGGTTISAGTLQIGNGSTTGSIVGNVTDNAALVFNRSDTVIYGGTISGTGTLTQAGSGTLTLTGNNTYSGITTVAAGRLNVNGAIAGNVQVNAGATLGGGGSVGGVAFLANGAHLAPGNSPGTLAVGSLLLSSGSLLDYELGTPNVIGGGINDLVNVTGDLTLAGTLNVASAGGFGSGVYRLINYGGALTSNGLAFGAQPSGFAPGDFLIQTSQPGQVNLIVQAGDFANQFWNGPQTTGNGVIGGGTGTWNPATTNWTGADGSTNAPWQSGFAIFQGGAGTVTLGENIGFGGMQFLTTGYEIAGAGFTLAGAPTTTIRTDPGVTAAIGAAIVDGAGGPVALVKSDAGTLVLTDANTYKGGTTIGAGTLQLGSGGATGSIVGDVSNNGVLAFNRSDALTFDGVVSGTGSLTQAGSGTVTLTGTNTYGGGTHLDAGILSVGADANLGDAAGALTFNGGTLQFTSTLASARAVTLNTTGTIDTQTHVNTLSGEIAGAGALTKQGLGTLILTADNSFTGGTTIAQGTLQLGNGGITGGVVGEVTNDGTLAIDRSSDLTLAGTISGSGTLNQIGTGTTVLSGANTYTGVTSVAAGTLQAGAADTFSATSAHVIASGATLDTNGFNQSVAGLTNGGTVSLTSGIPGSTLTVNGPYTGQNGVLRLATVLNAGGSLSNQQTDRLLVQGNASGTTLLQVTNMGGAGANTGTAPNADLNSEGISLVQVGGSSTPGAFQLAGNYVTGGTPFQYRLHAYGPGSPAGVADGSQSLVGNTSSNWDYRLQSAFVDPNGPATPPADAGGGDPVVRDTVRRQVAPQVPAYISAPGALLNAGLLQLESLHTRLGEIRDDQSLDGGDPREVFVRAIGGHADYRTNRSFTQYGYNFRQDLAGLTAGANGKVINDERGTLRVGLGGVYTHTSFTPAAADGQSEGTASYMGLAGMATWQARPGWYVDAILAGGWYEGKVTTPERGQTMPLRGSSVATSLEAGYPFALGWQQLDLEPQVQVVYQHLGLDRQTDADGIDVNLGSQNQVVLRAGARLSRSFDRTSGARLTPYAKLNVLHGLSGAGTVSVGGSSFTTGAWGTALQLGAGLTGTLTPRLSLYGELSGQHEIASGGFNSWAASGGLRYMY
ncbi:autotransporter-associated beta strand repeat-containing protein [Paraburkholderia sediminicola]|nr:autotransporter-associated beta strand repeat-containing protein [Paraburkholderia sediminicola]